MILSKHFAYEYTNKGRYINMALFNEQFPYVNAHQLNLDWIIAKIKEFDAKVTEFQEQLLM